MKTILHSAAVLLIACGIASGAEKTTQKVLRHPGHKMQVTFSPVKEPFALGEPVTVVLKITNIGQSDFMFIRGGRQRGARDNQFGFTAQAGDRMLPDIGNPVHYGGLGSFVTVKPKETVEIPVDLKKWFAFDREGIFELRGTYFMKFCDPVTETSSVIWEDFACAEFVITIRKNG